VRGCNENCKMTIANCKLKATGPVSHFSFCSCHFAIFIALGAHQEA
jgi:hypothetical protein